MSLFTDASLVMIPSGIKDQKVYSVTPTDGSGDLTFSRGSDIEATRVASNGYIEKAKVNLLTYSNDFSNWTLASITPTSGQSGYDGSSDAWELNKTNTGGAIINANTLSSLATFSVYAKAGTLNYVYFYINYLSGTATDTQAYFDLSTGSVGTTIAAIDANIEAIGATGWYRCDVSFNCPSALADIRIFPALADNNSGGTGTIYIQDAQLNYGLVAQTYQETTTAAVVSGITDDMPRLNYDPANPTCPSLLLEPSRTNLITQSEFFEDASWLDTDLTITSNYGISPEGVQNSTRLVLTNLTSSRIAIAPTLVDGTTYTFSCYYKGTAGEKLYMEGNGNGGSGTLVSKLITFTGDWQREELQFVGGSTSNLAYIVDTRNGTEDTAQDFEVYGAQLEAGNFVLSYIPCYGTSATRTADASTFDPSSLLGATQGSWFMELDDLTFEIAGTSVSSIWLGYNALNCLGLMGRTGANDKNISFVKEESNVITTLASKEISTTLKVCFVWNGTSLKCFVDGVKEYDDGSFVQPLAWSTLELNFFSRPAEQFLNKMLFFPTALSDADAIALTA